MTDVISYVSFTCKKLPVPADTVINHVLYFCIAVHIVQVTWLNGIALAGQLGQSEQQ